MTKFTLNFWAIFYVIAAAQGFFVALPVLKTKRGNKSASRYLSALVFPLAVYLFDLFLGRSNLLYEFLDLVYFAVPLSYLFAPLTYFYVKSHLKRSRLSALPSLPCCLQYVHVRSLQSHELEKSTQNTCSSN